MSTNYNDRSNRAANKPEHLDVDPENVPATLREHEKWVCWRYEQRDGKWTKPPIKPYDERTGMKQCLDVDDDRNGEIEGDHPYAASTGKHTWRSCKTALEYHEREDTDTDGIGFVITSGDLYAGADLDNCRDPETGDLEPWAREVIDTLDTYTEVSPSGTGLRCICLGVKPGSKSKTTMESTLDTFESSDLELYDKGRYLTITGAHVDGTPHTVKQRNSELERVYDQFLAAPVDGQDEDGRSESMMQMVGREHGSGRAGQSNRSPELSDEEVLEKARTAENGEKFTRLYNGYDGEHNSDTSKADKAFCQQLAFWTGDDRDQMDRLFRRSGRMRRKWDEQHSADGRTYGEMTIDAALADQTKFYGEESEQGTPARTGGDEINTTNAWNAVRAWYEDDEMSQKEARYQAVRTLRRTHEFATPRDTEKLYTYRPEEGVFWPQGEQVVAETLQRELGPHYSKQEQREIVAHLKARTYIDRDEFNARDRDAMLLCVENGVLDLETRDLHDHSPEYYFTNRVPWPYKPEAGGEAIDAFLDDITGREEDKLTLYEMVGNCLTPHYDYSSFLVLFGEGRNGKSTFFEIVEQLLGEENTASATLQNLAGNRFATSSLDGKFANIAPDMPSTRVNDMGMVKALTGGDRITAEEKHQPQFEFRNRAKLMFGANRPPVLGEQTDAIKERLLPVCLPKKFTSDPDDGNPMERDRRDLVTELTTSLEMSGFLNHALNGLDRLRETRTFSLPEDPGKRLEYYQRVSDPIHEFAQRCLVNEKEATLTKDQVYETYTRFCEANDHVSKDRNEFFKRLRQTTFTVEERRRRVDEERVKMLENAALTDEECDYHNGSDGEERTVE